MPNLNNIAIEDLENNRWTEDDVIREFKGLQGQIEFWRKSPVLNAEELAEFNAYVAERGLEPSAEHEEYTPQEGDYVRVVIEGPVTQVSRNGDWVYIGDDVYIEPGTTATAVYEKIDPPKPALPTEPGIYITAHPDVKIGNAQVFQLNTEGEWSVYGVKNQDPKDWVRRILHDHGLVRLTPEVS